MYIKFWLHIWLLSIKDLNGFGQWLVNYASNVYDNRYLKVTLRQTCMHGQIIDI